MHETEEGPCRRVSRRRRDAASTPKHAKTLKTTKCNPKNNQVSPINESSKNEDGRPGWFDNSFSAANSNKPCLVRVSTPKSTRKGRKVSLNGDSFNTSDTLFAELDLDDIVSQTGKSAASQQGVSASSNHDNSSGDKSESKAEHDVPNCSEENEKLLDASNKMAGDMLAKNEKLEKVSLSETLESQYFKSKFTSYKSTQPGEIGRRKEVMVQYNVTSINKADDTSFSFSFVDARPGDDSFDLSEKPRACDNNNETSRSSNESGKSLQTEVTEIRNRRGCLEEDGSRTKNERYNRDTDMTDFSSNVSVPETLQEKSVLSVTCKPATLVSHLEGTPAISANKSVSHRGSVNTDSGAFHKSPESANGTQALSSPQWNSRDFVSSTQLCDTQDREHVRYRCTPFKRPTQTDMDSQVLQESGAEFDITCLKDHESDTKIRCTPFVREGKGSTQSDTQLNGGTKFRCTPYVHNKDQNSHVNTTELCSQFNSQMNGKTKFRCTPYVKDKDSCSETQYKGGESQFSTRSQCVHGEVGGDLDESQLVSTAQCPRDQSVALDMGTQPLVTQYDSQIPATGMCEMTGLIVDSQTQGPAAKDQGDRDLFDDSIHDSVLVSQGQEMGSDLKNKANSTGSLSKTDKCSRKRSIDDDIDSIFQASQSRRNANKRVKKTDSDIGAGLRDITNEIGDSCADARHTSFDQSDNTSGMADHIQAGAVSFGVKSKSGSGTSESVLPKTPEATSLQERIKQKLKENAGQKSPRVPGSLVEQLRERALEQVRLEAEQLRARPNTDIGPFYGLPAKVKQLFEAHRGITSLYAWQEECLQLPAIQRRRNLIYSLPTSGGKTLVAEILILQELLCHKHDALIILPFVSIVQEKVRNLAQFAVDLDFHVEEYAGSKGRFPPLARRKHTSLYVATIEKAHSIVNSLIDADRLDKLGLVVVDELHMLGEGGSRGATLESTLMKLLHAAGPVQIIGMSATLSNIRDLTQFLNAEVYSNDFRPVKLTEYIKHTDNIFKVDTAAKCPDDQIVHERITCFQYAPEMEKTDPDQLLGLALEIIPDNSCLIFCPTKKNCENVALMLAKLMAKYRRELSNIKHNERKALLKELYSDADGRVCPVLRYTVQFGVAYHHGGLTGDERRLIEDAYAAGVLCLLACTSTLAAGVNLPAKRVILRSPYVGRSFISRSQYKQMAGRAGRAGIDSSGESIIICKPGDREKFFLQKAKHESVTSTQLYRQVMSLLSAPLEKCHSSLIYDGARGMRALILSTVGLKITTTTESVFKFMSRSLATIQEKSLDLNVQDLCRESLQKLIDLGLVLQTKTLAEDPAEQNVCHSLEVTALGNATVKGPIDPDYANRLYADLQRGKESLVVASHLHLLYLITPYDAVKDVTPSWFIYFNQMSSFNPNDFKVASLIGVPEAYVARQASQQRCRQKIDEFTVKRFYLTLMLYELWQQRSVWEVSERFEVPRGFVQTLLTSAASFATCVLHFCQEMEEFWAYQDLMVNFVKRLSYCVTAELIPLVEIPGVKIGRAKLMYNAGYRTLSCVANADVESLVKGVQYMPRKIAKQIIASAKLLLNEKAEAMMEEVDNLVAVPAGTGAGSVTMATMHTPTGLDTPDMSTQESVASVAAGVE